MTYNTNQDISVQNKSQNQILLYRAAEHSSLINRTANNDNITSPILTIKHQNGQITVQSEIKSNDMPMNETTYDLQRLLNISAMQEESKRMPDPSLNSFDVQKNNSVAAIECSQEEQEALGKLFKSMQRTYTAMQKVQKRATDDHFAAELEENK